MNEIITLPTLNRRIQIRPKRSVINRNVARNDWSEWHCIQLSRPLSQCFSSALDRRKAPNYHIVKYDKTGLRHRSVRALLTHTAPTLSQRVKRCDG